jgi:predicted ATPase
MASKRNRTTNLPAQYLRRVWLDPARIADRGAYPFCLPFLDDDFGLEFDRPIAIAGENGTGKSTLLEGIAVLAGYDEAGGGKGYRPSIIPTPSRRWAASFPARFAPAGGQR